MPLLFAAVSGAESCEEPVGTLPTKPARRRRQGRSMRSSARAAAGRQQAGKLAEVAVFKFVRRKSLALVILGAERGLPTLPAHFQRPVGSLCCVVRRRARRRFLDASYSVPPRAWGRQAGGGAGVVFALGRAGRAGAPESSVRKYTCGFSSSISIEPRRLIKLSAAAPLIRPSPRVFFRRSSCHHRTSFVRRLGPSRLAGRAKR